MRPNDNKVVEAVHYVIARTEPSELGAVKLNKALWYSDIEHYRRHGVSLTGLTEYTRMPQGPISKEILRALKLLKAHRAIHERDVKVFDYVRHEYISLREPDISSFTAEQIDILNQIMDVIRKHSAGVISEITHDAYWKELENEAPMPIGPGSVIRRPATDADIEWARQLPS